MNVHKWFTIITNLFGLNFYELAVPLWLILFLNIFVVNVIMITNIYYALVSNNPKMRSVYLFIDFIQLIMPLIMKNYLMLRAINMRSFDAKFLRKVEKTFEQSQMKINKKKFFIYFGICSTIFFTKMAFGTKGNSVIYNSSHMITTIINATSDFIFVYQILCLRDHLKFIRQSKCDVRFEILNVVEIKRLILHRFSINLMMSVSIDFFLIIVSLYWIFVRIVFHFLNAYQGKTNKKFQLMLLTLICLHQITDPSST